MAHRSWRGAGIYVAAVVALLWTLVPLYWLVNMSFMYKVETLSVPTHFFPQHFTLANYRRILGFNAVGIQGDALLPSGHSHAVLAGIRNSLIVSVVVTAITLIIALPVAYALGRLSFKGKNGLLFGILGARSFPPVAVLIPFFMMYTFLSLQGTRTGLVLVYLTLTVPTVAWMMMGFFASLPNTIEREARMDGCTRWQAFYKVLLPVSIPGVAVSAAISFLLAWNEFTLAMVLASGSPAQTLPPALSGMFLMISEPTEMAATSVLAVIPPLILCYFFQKQIRQLNILDPV